MIRTKHILFAAFFTVCTALHAETATYTVTSYHDIALTDGVAPEGSYATFMSTTASGARITAGNTATLTIAGFDGQFIQSVTLRMHSNNTSGAGSMSFYLDDELLAAIPDASFADASWNGAYAGGDAWANISVPLDRAFTVHAGGVMTIVVEASANSLYLGGCTLTYREGTTLPKMVAFSTGTEQTLQPIQERTAGKGVVLPSLPDVDGVWRFLGWTESPLPHTTACPVYYKAGMVYIPTRNIMLYALYTKDSNALPLVQDTLFESGEYALVSAEPYCCMMAGAVENKAVATKPVDLIFGPDSLYRLTSAKTVPPESRYSISFTDTTAVIRHVQSGSYVGYKASSTSYLNSFESEWRVLKAACHSVLFCHNEAGSYVQALFPNISQTGTFFRDTQLQSDAAWTYLLLFKAPDVEPEPDIFTTNPLSGAGLETVKAAGVTCIYRLDGSLVRTVSSEEAEFTLSPGIYIIHSPEGVQKRVVR